MTLLTSTEKKSLNLSDGGSAWKKFWKQVFLLFFDNLKLPIGSL